MRDRDRLDFIRKLDAGQSERATPAPQTTRSEIRASAFTPTAFREEGERTHPAKHDVSLIEVENGDGRTFANVRDSDVALLAQFSWGMEDGEAFTNLCDVYGLRVTMDYVINHPAIVFGSHSCN
jgi:hypothetical protein